MATTKVDITRWFKAGLKQGATHMCIICDTFDHEDFPRYVKPGEDPREVAGRVGNMERLMEVYSLSQPMEAQLAEVRAFHYD